MTTTPLELAERIAYSYKMSWNPKKEDNRLLLGQNQFIANIEVIISSALDEACSKAYGEGFIRGLGDQSVHFNQGKAAAYEEGRQSLLHNEPGEHSQGLYRCLSCKKEAYEESAKIAESNKVEMGSSRVYFDPECVKEAQEQPEVALRKMHNSAIEAVIEELRAKAGSL